MNKSLIIIGLAVVLVIVVAGAFFVFKGGGVLDVSVWQGDEAELANWANDIDVFAQDDAALQEFDQVSGEILQ